MRLEATFEALARANKKALVVYLCAGDPSAEDTVELAVACVLAGADVIELGVPFSDPTADGPVIARAAARSLARGGGLSSTLQIAKKIRARCEAPIVLFGYYNPIFVVGEARVCAIAQNSGADGLLVVDLPVEEGDSLRATAKEHGLTVVPLLTPTSSAARVAAAAEAMKTCPAGFVYYVSVAGVTGHVEASLEAASHAAGALREKLDAPVVVGFGVDSPERAIQAATASDGVVVGTAIVRRIEEAACAEDARASVSAFVKSLRAVMDERSATVQTD
jgi:tryptophan synthase alpha chain